MLRNEPCAMKNEIAELDVHNYRAKKIIRKTRGNVFLTLPLGVQ